MISLFLTIKWDFLKYQNTLVFHLRTYFKLIPSKYRILEVSKDQTSFSWNLNFKTLIYADFMMDYSLDSVRVVENHQRSTIIIIKESNKNNKCSVS